MKAIVTRQRLDGTFDDIGMSNRFVTKSYRSKLTLIRYGTDPTFNRIQRLEIFNGDSIYGKAHQIVFIRKGFTVSWPELFFSNLLMTLVKVGYIESIEDRHIGVVLSFHRNLHGKGPAITQLAGSFQLLGNDICVNHTYLTIPLPPGKGWWVELENPETLRFRSN